MQNFKIYSRAVILNKEKDKVLLIKKNNKQKIGASNWLLPGGTLDFNEEIELSLIREIKEETNLEITDLQLIFSKKLLIENTHWLGLYYLVNILNEDDLCNVEKNKHEIVKFVSLKEVPNLKDYSVLQFIKAIDLNRESFDAVPITENEHAMNEALSKYVYYKIHNLLRDNIESFSRIKIVGNYDRSAYVSIDEKSDKLFNFKRPTAFIDEDIVYISCFPGLDYVYHYAKLVSTYLKLNNISKEVSYIKPSLQTIKYAFSKTNLNAIPNADIIIFGNIDKIGVFDKKNFSGDGDFIWKIGTINDKKVLLLGCKFSIWGSTGYDFVRFLSNNIQFSTFIYVGKLGSLSHNIKPNEFIATGEQSQLKDTIVKWNNIFKQFDDKLVIIGNHITCPSVLDETKKQINIYKEKGNFIDPEIGNMALACKEYGKQFSYLHVISDNVVNHDNLENLSDERKSIIIEKRKFLFKKIGDMIRDNL